MAGSIQGADLKTEAELVTAGADKTYLPKDTQIYVTANSINKTLDDAIIDGDLSGGGGSATFPFEMYNLGLSVTVASNALTVAFKQADGSTDPASGSGAVKIGFRSSTQTSGAYVERSMTSATSLVVSSGSTLGTINGVEAILYVYALDNAGTIEAAICGQLVDTGILRSTTAEGGAGAADSGTTIYSTTARSNVALALVAKIRITETTAGTWATAPTEVSLTGPNPDIADKSRVCYFKDVKSSGTNGGTFTSGSYQTRTITNLFGDRSFASLSSNQITLAPGTYEWYSQAPAYRVDLHKSILYNVTDSTTVETGSSERTESTTGFSVTKSFILITFDITASKAFEIRHQCFTTHATFGFGINTGFGDNETYTQGWVRKIK